MNKKNKLLNAKEASKFLGISIGNFRNRVQKTKYDDLKEKFEWVEGQKKWRIEDLEKVKTINNY